MRAETAERPAIANQVWEMKYSRPAADGTADPTLRDTWRRVANAAASIEQARKAHWAQRFYEEFDSLRFIPGGRIIAGAGRGEGVTLFNCFVLPIADSAEAVAKAVREGAATMRQGGGVGYDVSNTHPSGVTALLRELDGMCDMQLSGASRRGAMMATLRCDHPDIEAFANAKRLPGALGNFNLSVQVTDAFMAAVRDNGAWPLIYPLQDGRRVHAKPRARAVWETICRAAYDSAEPGILFVDRINALNNLWYREHITAANPCGEVPLADYGACNLGSLNLPRFVLEPFTPDARIDEAALRRSVRVAVRFLDNVIDLSGFPLPQQRAAAQATRRIGLGVMGLADALIMLGLRYDTEAARETAERVMKTICNSAYRSSAALAETRGSFPAFDRDLFLAGRFVGAMPAGIRGAIARGGIRNSHLVAIAPTGSISLLAGAVSSGIEPVFESSYRRRLGKDGEQDVEIVNMAVRQYRTMHVESDALPPSFVAIRDVAPADQLAMQAVIQRHVDNAISKTVTVAAHTPFESIRDIYERANELGLKGCTIYRPGTLRGSICSGTCEADR